MVDPGVNRKIFKIILEEPAQLIQIYKKSGKKIHKGTISKILNRFKTDELIELYEIEKAEDEEAEFKNWGPTILGIIEICVYEKNIVEQLGKIFDRWIPYSEFKKGLEKFGFERRMVNKESDKTKKNFKKYIKYAVGIRTQVNKLLYDPNSFDLATLYSIGEFLLLQKPENQKVIKELYKALPGVKKNVDINFKNIRTQYRRFKKIEKK